MQLHPHTLIAPLVPCLMTCACSQHVGIDIANDGGVAAFQVTIRDIPGATGDVEK